MDEEEKLINELEVEQQQALQIVIEEEESWLKEFVREENIVIDVEIEIETENEFGVSLDLLICGYVLFCLLFFV